MRLLAQHKYSDYGDFSKLLRLLIVSLCIPLSAAKHYECDWDPLDERSPEKAGFEQLCSARPTDTVSGSPPTAYYCNVNGGFGQRQYIVAGYNTVQGEIEFGEWSWGLQVSFWKAADSRATISGPAPY